MAIFNSYVSLPEGILMIEHPFLEYDPPVFTNTSMWAKPMEPRETEGASRVRSPVG